MAASTRTTKLASLSAFGYRDFRLFFVGAISSYSGYGIITMAVGWLVLELTDSKLLLGLATFSASVPVLFFGPLGGVAADRLNRRWLMLASETISVGLIIFLATLTALGVITVWQIIPIALLRGALWAFNFPAQNALLPNLVGSEAVNNAVMLYNMIWNISRILGPALGGALVGIFGIEGCLYAAGILSMIMTLSALTMRPTHTQLKARNTSFLTELMEGLRYVKHNPNILGLLLLAAIVAFFGLTYIMLLPVFARDILVIGAPGLGMLMTSAGLGALAGSITVTLLSNMGRRGLVMFTGAIAFAIMLIIFASSRSVALSIPLLLITGSLNSAYVATTNALLYAFTEEQYRGRVMSLYNLTWGLMAIGSLPSGAIANLVGAPLAVTLGAVISGISTVAVAALVPSLRKFD